MFIKVIQHIIMFIIIINSLDPLKCRLSAPERTAVLSPAPPGGGAGPAARAAELANYVILYIYIYIYIYYNTYI